MAHFEFKKRLNEKKRARLIMEQIEMVYYVLLVDNCLTYWILIYCFTDEQRETQTALHHSGLKM